VAAQTQSAHYPHFSPDKLKKSHLVEMLLMEEECIVLSYPGNFIKLLLSPHPTHPLILFFATS
jgi:hypothetical protein